MVGYDDLAALTARFPELFIVRKFDRLSAQIVLDMQAELLNLERDLDIFVEMDEGSPDSAGMSASWLRRQQVFTNHGATLQREKFEEVKEKLKIYHETLLRISQIRQLGRPSERNRSRLWKWLTSRKGGKDFLQGIEADPWDVKGEQPNLAHDLAVISPGCDSLDQWLADSVVPKYHHLFGPGSNKSTDPELLRWDIREYEMKKLHSFGNVICVVLSALGPVASILTLYWIPNTIWRLVAICLFIITCAIAMMYVSGSRRAEVFATTAAFAALQVVFLQGLSGAINCH